MNLGLVILLILVASLAGAVLLMLAGYVSTNRAISKQNSKLIDSLNLISDKLSSLPEVEILLREYQKKLLVDNDGLDINDIYSLIDSINERLNVLYDKIEYSKVGEVSSFNDFLEVGNQSVDNDEQEKVEYVQLNLFTEDELKEMEVVVENEEESEEKDSQEII